jgi:hypothetical protein
VPPSFLIEEMLHRNALFCLRHAEEMPDVVVEEPVVTDLGDGLKAVDVVFRNDGNIPTRTAMASEKEIGLPDRFTIRGDARVLAGGFRTDRFRPAEIELAEERPETLVRDAGIPGRGEVRVRWYVRGRGRVTVGWSGEKGRDVTARVQLGSD